VLQRFCLVNCNVIGFIALDDVLRLFLRSMVQIAFETNSCDNLLNDHATNPSCFRVPLNMVTALERLRHPITNNCGRARRDDAISSLSLGQSGHADQASGTFTLGPIVGQLLRKPRIVGDTAQPSFSRQSIGFITRVLLRVFAILRPTNRFPGSCTNCARIQRFHSIRVTFERKADSPICWKR